SGGVELGWEVGAAFALPAVARDVQVLAAVAAAAIILAGEVLFDLPHRAGAVAVEHMRGGQLPAQVDGATRMHREELANVVAIERDQIGDLFSLGLGELELLPGLDLEADVPARGEGHRLTRTE